MPVYTVQKCPMVAILKISNNDISEISQPIHFVFDSKGRRVELSYFHLDEIQVGGRPPSLKL